MASEREPQIARCETCGGRVIVVGKTTLHYTPLVTETDDGECADCLVMDDYQDLGAEYGEQMDEVERLQTVALNAGLEIEALRRLLVVERLESQRLNTQNWALIARLDKSERENARLRYGGAE